MRHLERLNWIIGILVMAVALSSAAEGDGTTESQKMSTKLDVNGIEALQLEASRAQIHLPRSIEKINPKQNPPMLSVECNYAEKGLFYAAENNIDVYDPTMVGRSGKLVETGLQINRYDPLKVICSNEEYRVFEHNKRPYAVARHMTTENLELDLGEGIQLLKANRPISCKATQGYEVAISPMCECTNCLQTSGFGERLLGTTKDIHHGIDISTDWTHPPINAMLSGVVTKVISHCRDEGLNHERCGRGSGNQIIIKTTKDTLLADGTIMPAGTFVMYAHLNIVNPEIKVGKQIEQGAYLGEVGNTGHSTAPHLCIKFMKDSDYRGKQTSFNRFYNPELVLGAVRPPEDQQIIKDSHADMNTYTDGKMAIKEITSRTVGSSCSACHTVAAKGRPPIDPKIFVDRPQPKPRSMTPIGSSQRPLARPTGVRQ